MNKLTIGMNIKRILRDRGITQKELAEFLNVSKQVLSNNLRGANNLSIDKVIRISEFLELPVEDILYPDKPKPISPKKYASLGMYKLDSVEYPDMIDNFGKTVIDYYHETKQIYKFEHHFKKKLFPNNRFTRNKMVAFMIKNNMKQMLFDQISRKNMDLDSEDTAPYYRYLLPVLKLKSKLLKKVDPTVHTIDYFNLSERDFIESILTCNDKNILNLIPDSYKNIRVRSKKVGTTRKSILITFNYLMRIALETDNVFVFDYFRTRYNYKLSRKELDIAEVFGSRKLIEYIMKEL